VLFVRENINQTAIAVESFFKKRIYKCHHMLEKLIKKVISKHLQFQLIANNFIHSNELEELK